MAQGFVARSRGFIELDSVALAHLQKALVEHRGWCRTNAVEVPAALAQVTSALAESVSQRVNADQAGSDVDALVPVPHDAAVTSILNADEVASMLRVSRATVFRMAKAGELPRVTIGRLRRFTRSGIDQYLAQNSERRP